jgi:hypothetical protein
MAIAGLGSRATPALVVGLLGAFGDSAGGAGIPFLAQATLLMRLHKDAFNETNAHVLVLLAERLGLSHPLCAPLCALGLILMHGHRGMPDHTTLAAAIQDLVERCAATRSIPVAALMDEIEADIDPVGRLVASLRALVPPDLWLIAAC